MNSAGRAVLLSVFLHTVLSLNTLVAYAQEAQGASQEQATVQHVALSANTTLQAKDVSHFDPAKYTLPIPLKNSTTVAAKAARVESAVTTAQEFASKIPGFVSASGQNFILNGKAAYFAGTNAWYLPIRATYSDNQISQFFSVMAGQGVTLVRVFCFEDGYTLSNTPIQSSPGVYDENGLKRIDLIMATAAQYGIYVIVVPTNFEPVGGGISWYVDQLVGSGNAKELFYTDSRCKQAYKNYVSMLLNRVNTYTGVQYKNDPTMFSFELMNEPHTTDLYEINRGMPPGKLVRDWIYEMSAFVKGIDSNHMVSTGEEGYRADGPTNPPHNNWINGGWKGVDFVGNVNCPHIDFATTHVYPDNWAIQAYEFDWVNANFIRDRASIAHAANKPIIMEETGMQRGYLSSRNTLLSSLFGEANNDNFGATMIWEWIAWNMDDRSYDFSVGQDGSTAEQAQINYMTSKSGGAVTSPSGPPSGPPSGSTCTNTPPDSSASCAQQVGWHPGCTVAWLQSPYCNQECGRCSSGSPSSSTCSDNPPDNTYTCAQQVGWGKCGEAWMQGFCNQSCGRCTSSCSDNPPPSSAYSCNQQAGWGKCSESWMTGYCLKSCGKC